MSIINDTILAYINNRLNELNVENSRAGDKISITSPFRSTIYIENNNIFFSASSIITDGNLVGTIPLDISDPTFDPMILTDSLELIINKMLGTVHHLDVEFPKVKNRYKKLLSSPQISNVQFVSNNDYYFLRVTQENVHFYIIMNTYAEQDDYKCIVSFEDELGFKLVRKLMATNKFNVDIKNNGGDPLYILTVHKNKFKELKNYPTSNVVDLHLYLGE